MDYRTAMDHLYSLRRYAFEPGTERTERVLASLGHPERSFDAIQIAGTNGKGSTASMLTSILEDAGYRVGLYTSPHLESFHERIQVNSRPITESAITRFVDAVAEQIPGESAGETAPTFFEVTTALAYWYFAEQAVDIAVVEVGIGGSKDATSVVDPIAVGITSIALEHTDVLGSTIEDIAADKASIATPDIPVITGVTEPARSVLYDHIPHMTIIGTGDDADVTVEYRGIVDDLEAGVSMSADDWTVETRSPLLGSAQAVNAGVAATLAHDVFGLEVACIARGIRGVVWPGRVELLDRDPLVIADGAHNPAACAYLGETMDELDFAELHLIFGAMADKDIERMADAFASATSVTTCRPATPRAADPSSLKAVFDELGVENVTAVDSVLDAVEYTLTEADAADCVLITGSLFTVGEARSRWTRPVTPRRVTSTADARYVLERCHLEPGTIDATGGDLVHRVFRTRLARRDATALKALFTDLGGRCIISPIELDGNPVEVLLTGTTHQFDTLRDWLQQRGGWGTGLASQLASVGDTSTPADAQPWGEQPVVMGIINPTPDSFHDGGRYDTQEAAIQRAHQLIDEGAAIIDIGGESTRPGGEAVPVEEELARILPIIEAIGDRDVLISVDTRKAEVAERAIEAGAGLINDVSGLEDPAMPAVAAANDVPLILMHSHATPVDPTVTHEHDAIVEEVYDELARLIRRCLRHGLERADLIVDPGIGFGKTKAENFALLDRLDEFAGLGCPILVGHSNKSMFELVDLEAGESRRPGTVAGTALAVERGADIIRVHDVAENIAAVNTAMACRRLN